MAENCPGSFMKIKNKPGFFFSLWDNAAFTKGNDSQWLHALDFNFDFLKICSTVFDFQYPRSLPLKENKNDLHVSQNTIQQKQKVQRMW